MSLPAEGRLDIEISVADGLFGPAIIRNQRPVGATAALAGRSPGEAVRLVTRLFSVCRLAQGVAAAEAVEQAAGQSAGAVQRQARRMLLAGEMVLEHASRALLDWPMLAGEAPSLAALKALRGALAALHGDLYPAGDWMCPGGGGLAPSAAPLSQRLATARQVIGQAVFGGDAPVDPPSWRRWLATAHTATARLLAGLVEQGLAGFGASSVTTLPALDPVLLATRLAADADGAFVIRPDWQGAVHQTGPLARQAGQPLVAAILAESGPGLLALMAARLVELASALWEMEEIAARLCQDDGLFCSPAEGSGLGVVEAARGRLVHRVEMREGRVSRYQILAPTEWNFHPHGALVDGLLGQPAGRDPEGRARLLIAALDPCVDYRLSLADA